MTNVNANVNDDDNDDDGSDGTPFYVFYLLLYTVVNSYSFIINGLKGLIRQFQYIL